MPGKEPSKPTKADVEAQNERLSGTLKRMRDAGKELDAKIGQMGTAVAFETVGIGAAGAAGYWRGKYGKEWKILGVDASLVVGAPVMIGGYVATLFGYGTIGAGLTAIGRGLVIESVASMTRDAAAKKPYKAEARNEDGSIDRDADPKTPAGLPDFTITPDGVMRGGKPRVASGRYAE